MNIIDPLKGHQKTVLCLSLQLGDVRLLDALHPDAVLLAVWSGNRDHLVDDQGTKVIKAQQGVVWEAGVRSMIGDLRQRGIPYGMILDEPTLPINAVDCIARLNQIAVCERTRSEALAISEPLLDVERKVMAENPSAPTLDLTDVLCDADHCRLEIDGHLVYADSHHLTDAFATYAQPLVEPIVATLLP